MNPIKNFLLPLFRYVSQKCVGETIRTDIEVTHYVIESETVEMDLGIPEHKDVDQNLEDVVGMDSVVAHVGTTSYINTGQRVVQDINMFLERPILIDNHTFPIATDQSLTYAIWDLVSSNAKVRNKFEHFAYFSGDLEVHISFSGTPFHYGKVLVSYQPYPEANATLQQYIAEVAANPNMRQNFLMYLSQARSCKIIDIKDNQPVVMKIPFISYKPMWRLFNDSTLALGTDPYDDFRYSGTLFIETLNAPQAVSATPSAIQMLIRARFINVQLGTLTGTRYVAEMDETKTGPVEKFTSSAAEVAGVLSVVPELAPFTIPAMGVLESMSQVSSYFGWSKPSLDENRVQMKPDAFNNGMVVSGNDTVKVMGVDKKRSLEVSQGMFGSLEDELSLEYLSNRQSYLKTFTWQVSDIPMTSSIATLPVTPFIENVVVNVNAYKQTTPIGFVARPFTFWRGELEFTFQFVCSAYHRGKMAFIFEPNVSQSPLIDSNFNLNQQYIKIIDLEEVQTVTFCIPWASEYPWREVRPVATDVALFSNSYCNGQIFIVPYTALQSPDASSIEVNVFMSGKNMHYAMPTDVQENRLYFAESEVNEAEVSFFGVPTPCYKLNESTATTENLPLVTFGERVVSFRSLLKRYTYIGQSINGAPANSFYDVRRTIYPLIDNYYGDIYNPNAPLISYLRLAFLAMRGSYRHRIKFFGIKGEQMLDHINVSLVKPETSAPANSGNGTDVYSPINFVGGVTYLPHVNGGVEVDLPFYSNNLWVFSQQQDLVQGEMETLFSKRFSVFIPIYDNDAIDPIRVIDEGATGEDFNLHYFTGAPPYNIIV